jgi:hypothetical protein
MTKTDKVVVILLRYLLGIPGLLALVAVFLPLSWMVAIHHWLGLGRCQPPRSWNTWPARLRLSTPSLALSAW